MPVLGPGPVVLRSSFVSDRAKKREREENRGVEGKEESGKGGRVADTAKAPGGFIEFAPLPPPPSSASTLRVTAQSPL